MPVEAATVAATAATTATPTATAAAPGGLTTAQNFVMCGN